MNEWEILSVEEAPAEWPKCCCHGCDIIWRDGAGYHCGAGYGYVVIYRRNHERGKTAWGVLFRVSPIVAIPYVWRSEMASKWIVAARQSKGEVTKRSTANDPYLFKDRPAIADFMLDYDDGDSGTRELSSLMVTVQPDGFRVGLKDPVSGGWCWREGDTLKKCLDAIDAAIQGGGDAFRVAGGNRPKKK